MKSTSKRRKKRRYSKDQDMTSVSAPGTPPGTIVPAPDSSPPTIDVIAYDVSHCYEQRLNSIDELPAILSQHHVTWINVEGLGDADLVKRLGSLLELHQLALEDVMGGHQRAKMEVYGEHLFIVTRMVFQNEDLLDSEQLSIFVGNNFILTFQDSRPGDCLDPVRDRIRKSRGRIKTSGPDYLAYTILDTVIDAYFPVLEGLGDKMDLLEDAIIENQRKDTISNVHSMKRDLLTIRRAIWPLREVVNNLIRDSNPVIHEETRLYFRDCYDHTVRIIDFVETYRELAADLRDLYLSMMSNRLNEVIKVLTIISTIFIPLTFIVGVYGMNFNTEKSPWNMPELNWAYGYPAVLILMFSIVIGLLLFFRHKGWLGNT